MEQIDKSVIWVTVWLHSAEPRDARTVTLGTYYKNPTLVWGVDRQICPKGHCLASRGSAPVDPYLLTNDRFFFLHTFVCKKLE